MAHQSGLYTGMVLGGAWGGWMGETAGWRPVFTILGVVGLLYFGVLLIGLRRDPPAASRVEFFSSLATLLRNRSFRLLTAAFVASGLSNWLIYTWLPLFLYERFHLSLTGAGSMTLLISISALSAFSLAVAFQTAALILLFGAFALFRIDPQRPAA